MTAKPIPDGYHTVIPYLLVPGVPGVIDFMKRAFGGEETYRTTRPDGTVMHAQVRIGDSLVMIGDPGKGFDPLPGSIHLYVTDTDATYRRALKAGATSVMEPRDQFYGDRNAGVKDAAGNYWWIATHMEDVPPDELEKRAQAFAKQQKGR